MVSFHARDFQRKLTSTRVLGVQILSEYEVLLVPVTGTVCISKPGNAREYPGGSK